MAQFLGVVHHEFNMSVRRKGLWIAYALVCLFFAVSLFGPSYDGPHDLFVNENVWQQAGEMVYLFNMLIPLIGGILAADRMQRDIQLEVRELQSSTPQSYWSYILGKYTGALLSILLPMLLWIVGVGIFAIVARQAPPALIGTLLLAFLAIVVPSFAFVIAFSLACPLVMPLRVYQILFTGYWFWGNFISPNVLPTISHTLLNASGIYAQQGFFMGSGRTAAEVPYTALEAWLNILVLGLCASAALFTLKHYLAWKSNRA
ncbi:MAG: ABC transporter permease subunit [Anaerolineae bacterium]|nr:ABC transporter permease subunit [Anaerolineae bacterium]